MQKTHRGVSPHIGELARLVRRHQEQRPLVPLERVPVVGALVSGPQPGLAASGDDVDDLVDRQSVGRQRLAGRDLGDPRLAQPLLADQLDERGVTITLVPAAEFDGAQIGDEVAPVDRQLLPGHPVVIKELAAGAGGFIGHAYPPG